jgi:hypothetical protein
MQAVAPQQGMGPGFDKEEDLSISKEGKKKKETD